RPARSTENPSMRKHKILTVLTVLGLTWTGIAGAQDKPLEEQLVDALTKVFGAYSGFRSNHAKGIVVEGSFKASPEAADLSRIVQRHSDPRDHSPFRCNRNPDDSGWVR